MTTDTAKNTQKIVLRGLNARQLAFCKIYVDNKGNATQAYKDAGYSPTGADRAASRMLRLVEIQDEITRIKAIPVRTSGSIRSFVIANLEDLAVNGQPDSARVAATVALGKTERMFVDVMDSPSQSQDVPELKTYTLDELVALRAVMVDGRPALSEPLEDVVDMDDGDDGDSD